MACEVYRDYAERQEELTQQINDLGGRESLNNREQSAKLLELLRLRRSCDVLRQEHALQCGRCVDVHTEMFNKQYPMQEEAKRIAESESTTRIDLGGLPLQTRVIGTFIEKPLNLPE
jgi:hypothetical protein